MMPSVCDLLRPAAHACTRLVCRSSSAQEAASALVTSMITQWDAADLTSGYLNSEAAKRVLSVCELAHAKLHRASPAHPIEVKALREALHECLIDETVRINPTVLPRSLPLRSYCMDCGEYMSARTCTECARCVTQMVDYDPLAAALVWPSLFHDLGLNPVAVEGTVQVSLTDLMELMPLIRPYRSLVALGLGAFTLQCYFVTHLVFVQSRWGRVRLTPRSLYCEELIFLSANMRVVMWLNDPELVGEFVHALHILGCGAQDAPMQYGRHYLLSKEQQAPMRGNWVVKDTAYKTLSVRRCQSACAATSTIMSRA